MKPIVLIGKGPSAEEIPASDDYDVGALNGAVKLAEVVDYLFVNDVSALKEVTLHDAQKVIVLVVPNYLHENTKGTNTKWSNACFFWWESALIERYNLPSAPEKNTEYPSFGRVLSVGESAVAWLLHTGYRDFITCGIDSEGGYHKCFDGGQQQLGKPLRHFRENYRRIKDRIGKASGTLTTWKKYVRLRAS